MGEKELKYLWVKHISVVLLRKSRVKPLSVEDRCYIAGLIDGDGTISLFRIRNARYPNSYHLRPHVQVANTKKDIVLWLKETTGVGCVSYHRAKKEHYRDYWSWDVYTLVDVKSLLEAILPYLKVRKKQAKLLIDFCKSRLEGHKQKNTPEEIKIYETLKNLNQRGR